MVTQQQSPNDQLRALIGEARWTNGGLARMVNAVGAEAGIPLRYDRSAVSHWLSGARPRGEAPSLIAEAFSRKLGRPVTIADTGLQPTMTVNGNGSRFPSDDAVTDLVQLTRSELDRYDQPAARRPIYSLAIMRDATSWTDLANRVRKVSPRTSRLQSATRIGPGETAAARRMAGAFTVADRGFGGGHARGSLAAYLACDVSLWLRADCSGEVRKELFGVATELSALAGFMAFDDQEHGLAQRYFLTALRFAVEGDSRLRYCLVIKKMSQQAAHLGHAELAHQLVEGALAVLPDTAPPRVRACLHSQAALACAMTHDRELAVIHLRDAERHLRRTTTGADVPSYFHAADLAFQTAQVLSALRNPTGAMAALGEAIRKLPSAERRSQALAYAWLAELQLRGEQVAEACESWQHFLERYPYLHSGRANTALARMRRELGRYERIPAARSLLTTAAAVSRVDHRRERIPSMVVS